jgi:hypothetical protein
VNGLYEIQVRSSALFLHEEQKSITHSKRQPKGFLPLFFYFISKHFFNLHFEIFVAPVNITGKTQHFLQSKTRN